LAISSWIQSCREPPQTLPVQAYCAVFSPGRAFTELSGKLMAKHVVLHSMFESDRIHGANGHYLTAIGASAPEAEMHPCRDHEASQPWA